MEGNERKGKILGSLLRQERKQRQVPVSRQQERALTQTPKSSCHSEAGGDGSADQTQPIFVETHGGNEALNHSRTQTQPDGEVRRLKSNTS